VADVLVQLAGMLRQQQVMGLQGEVLVLVITRCRKAAVLGPPMLLGGQKSLVPRGRVMAPHHDKQNMKAERQQ